MMLQSGAGRSNFIDFERILSSSGILPCKGLPARVNHDSVMRYGTTCNNTSVSSTPSLSTGASLNMSDNVCNSPSLRPAIDDLAAHIPTALKQQICRGEDINLALLLKRSERAF